MGANSPICRPGLLEASCAALREPAAASIAQAAQAAEGLAVAPGLVGLY